MSVELAETRLPTVQSLSIELVETRLPPPNKTSQAAEPVEAER